MIPCDSYVGDLKAYLDGELPLRRRATIRLHVARCRACREEVEAMEQIGNELRLGDAGGLDAGLRERILDAAQGGGGEGAAAFRIPSRRRLGRPQGRRGAEPARGWWARHALHVWAAAAVGVIAWFVLLPVISQQQFHARIAMAPQVEAMKSMREAPRHQLAEGRRYVGGPPGHDTDGSRFTATLKLARPGVERRAMHANKMAFGDGHSKVQSADTGIDANGNLAGYGRGVSHLEPPKVATGRAVKKTAEVTVEVDRLEEKSESLEQMVREAGGYVANNQLSTGEDDVKLASLELKVPVATFDSVLARIARLGEVKAKNVTGEDLGEEMSDQRQAERALADEMDDARQKLSEARSRSDKRQASEEVKDLKVEIAQAQGRLERLKKEARLSTITVNLRERVKPVPTKTGGFLDGMGDTGRYAWSCFLTAARLPFLALIWVVAYAPVWVPLAIAYRCAARASRHRTAIRENRDWQARRAEAG